MNMFERYSRQPMWLFVLLLSVFVAGCGGGGGGQDPILGSNGIAILAPAVTATAPVNAATGVSTNIRFITADFSERIAPITGAATFVITCAAPCVSPTGTVTLDATSRIATLTLAPGTVLSALTVYTGTITGATSAATGVAMTAPFVWQFTTGATIDSTRPRVILTVPATSTPGPTTGVATNTAISAVFSEDMDPATITTASFRLHAYRLSAR